jgi:hypothetical protein
MEDARYIDPIADNGREVSIADLNALGDTAALADDRVLAELLRIAPYSSGASKAVIPYAFAGFSGSNAGIVSPGPSGKIRIQPFRAIVGSRAAVGSGAKANWRDIRSAIVVGTTTLAQDFVVADAEDDFEHRWDLFWVKLTLDAVTSEARYKKDPTTKAVTAATRSISRTVAWTIGFTKGTTGGAPPVRPSIPADTATEFYVPLAYVGVPGSFNSGQTITTYNIFEVAPTVQLSRATGAASLKPANQLYKDGGVLLTKIPWNVNGFRPGPLLPPTMTGSESRLVAMQLGSSLPASVADNDIIDDSVDWRNRIFRWSCAALGGSVNKFAFDPSLLPGHVPLPDAGALALSAGSQSQGLGQSMVIGEIGYIAVYAAFVDSAMMSQLGVGSAVGLYVDQATGSLKVKILGTPNAQVFFWLEASGPFANL